MLFFLKYGQRGKTTGQLHPITSAHALASPFPPPGNIQDAGWTSHHNCLWRHAVGWEWTPGGARRTWATSVIFLRKMFPILRLFLYTQKSASLCDNTKGQSPIFLQKEGSHAQYLHCHDQQEGMSFGAAHVQTGLAHANSFKVNQAGSICAGKLKSCKTIRQCLQMVPAARRWSTCFLYETQPGHVKAVLIPGLVATCYLVTQGGRGDRNKQDIFWVPVINHAECQAL